MSIERNELAPFLLHYFPGLAESMPEELSSPHRVIRIFFDYVSRAIRNRNVAEVVECFRVTKILLDRCDDDYSSVRNALWTSYLNRFSYNDPVILDIFRELDSEVREAIYSPVVYPHHWLEEIEIELPKTGKHESFITIANEAEEEVRYIRQSCGLCRFAIVRLRMIPSLDHRSVLFRNRMDKEVDAPLRFVEAVNDGVTQALSHSMNQQKAFGYLRIELLKLRYHPVDSSEPDFVKVAIEAVEKCIAQVGLVELEP